MGAAVGVDTDMATLTDILGAAELGDGGPAAAGGRGAASMA